MENLFILKLRRIKCKIVQVNMEAVDKVSSEIEKVITKFSAISDHSSKLIANEIESLMGLKSLLEERKLDRTL